MKRTWPSKWAEAVVAVLLPPACREEVLGDLHERYRSPGLYWLDALSTVPSVVVSRVRRTADPQKLVIQACALFGALLGAGWWRGETNYGLLAIPSAAGLVGLALEEAYECSWPAISSAFILMGLLAIGADGWGFAFNCGVGLSCAYVMRGWFGPRPKLASMPPLFGLFNERWKFMNWRVAVVIVLALSVGFAGGVFAASDRPFPVHYIVNAIPFLTLLLVWIVLMAIKLSRRPQR